ncbi:MAG: DUF2478 domain-containing protein [Pararhodobacter sp.]|nr:DUF2478 domain-containing protein [Pararhodobacter sp.]
MNIACTMAPGKGDTDLLLQRLVQSLEGKGLRAAGTVQINTDREDEAPCDMDVLVLPDGPSLRISQSLGRNSRGCRLDAAALETAVGLVEARLRGGVDFLIVNKFGKHEAEGRGFRPVIAEAVALGIPVLVGLNALNRQPFADFTGGLAVDLAPDLRILSQWLLQAHKGGRDAA